MIVGNCFEYTTARYPQSFVAQVLNMLTRIMVVDIASAMVVKTFVVVQYWIFD